MQPVEEGIRHLATNARAERHELCGAVPSLFACSSHGLAMSVAVAGLPAVAAFPAAVAKATLPGEMFIILGQFLQLVSLRAVILRLFGSDEASGAF